MFERCWHVDTRDDDDSPALSSDIMLAEGDTSGSATAEAGGSTATIFFLALFPLPNMVLLPCSFSAPMFTSTLKTPALDGERYTSASLSVVIDVVGFPSLSHPLSLCFS